MIVRSRFFREDTRNHDWTPEQYQEGIKLEQIVMAHTGDDAAMEAATKKAGFSQDSLGNWFVTKGTVTTIDRLTLQKETGPNVIRVPTPVSLTAGLSRASQRHLDTIPAF